MLKNKTKVILEILAAYIALIVFLIFSKSILGLGNSLTTKMALQIAIYVVVAAIPVIVLLLRKIPFSILGFQKARIGKQLGIGLLICAITVSVGVIIPLLTGADKADVLSFKSPSIQVLIFYILFDLICVGFGEELFFRGYLYGRIKSITNAAWLPMVLSAVLFGFMHFPNTHNFLNVATTTLLGLLYGFCRWKIKDCSLLSLSIAHGLNDAAIIALSFFLL